MKHFIFLIGAMIIAQQAVAEFYDPMRPPAYALRKFKLEKLKSRPRAVKSGVKQQVKPNWVLSSILYSDQRKHAIINGKLVKKGDIIKGAKLLRLRPDSVRLFAKGKIIELKLNDLKSSVRIKSIRKSLNEKKI